ncbi:hypothetical protein E8E14_007132 [Neopestalotiopsis sp. 37M]|nr:hypothetical protein E8E14_007132 [Neopestalotiopsis sp. 37M]
MSISTRYPHHFGPPAELRSGSEWSKPVRIQGAQLVRVRRLTVQSTTLHPRVREAASTSAFDNVSNKEKDGPTNPVVLPMVASAPEGSPHAAIPSPDPRSEQLMLSLTVDTRSLNHTDGPHELIQDGLTIDTESRTPDSSHLSVYNASANSIINPLKDTQEELFLLRHYSECVAPWMDHLYRYEVFSREVLSLAREHPLLRYAACAVAARQLGQMRTSLSTILRGKTQENLARLAQGRLGFGWYGAKYYEMAIQTLAKSISRTDAAANQVSTPMSLSQGNLMVHADKEDPIVRLLGTCILIQYEQLGASRNAWSGHLTGFSKLLALIDDGSLLIPNPVFEAVYPFTKDVMYMKAGFWNFVVNDLEESFVSRKKTRVDTGNLALWRNMGLVIEDDGTVTNDVTPNGLFSTPEHARDKVLSFALVRLLCMLVDYVAPLSSNLNLLLSHDTTAYEYLETHFDSWLKILSPSFQADGTFLTRQSDEQDSDLFNRELWFSNDLCSTTMMYYHMARMLLLIHRPSDIRPGTTASAPVDLLLFFRDIEQKLRYHASEVIAIINATPSDAVKLRAIQPLYVAGRCCIVPNEQRLLIKLLRSIEDNLGIATDYRVKSLLQEWRTSCEALDLDTRVPNPDQSP